MLVNYSFKADVGGYDFEHLVWVEYKVGEGVCEGSQASDLCQCQCIA
jgi:hypothetical protein